MTNGLFLASLAATFGALFLWAFRALPRERWQIIAAVPVVKTGSGAWQGLNLTWYGFFQATSNALAFAILLLLLGAIGVPVLDTFALLGAVFAVCWPASRLIARAVEKKKHTFTVGGAVFVGALVAPWLLHGINAVFNKRLPVIPALAAAAVAYAFGEGFGRLACISFGCCYGKQIEAAPPAMRRVFNSLHFVFAGATKKVAYEGGMEGVRVVPIQAITAVAFTLIALAGAHLYLQSRFTASLVLTMTATQLWRFFSEMLRADVRGPGRCFSAYQAMALVAITYLAGVAAFTQSEAPQAEIAVGLRLLWDPSVLLFGQALWVAVFLTTGRSMVTGSTVSFFVHQDRI
jgi:hypothetical protein